MLGSSGELKLTRIDLNGKPTLWIPEVATLRTEIFSLNFTEKQKKTLLNVLSGCPVDLRALEILLQKLHEPP